MNWYFNNQGAADGPYDEAEMRAQVKKGAVTAATLVWQVSMETWREASLLNAAWWQPLPPKTGALAASAKVPTGPLTSGLRRPVPLAPMDTPKPSKVGSFLKKLFSRGDKEA